MKIKCNNCGFDRFTEKKVDEIFNINDNLFLVKNISAMVCDRCDERYYKPEIQREAMKMIKNKSMIVNRIETEVYEMV